MSGVRQLRDVVTADDYEAAVAFHRDVVGMPAEAAYESEDGRVSILAAGRVTLEIADRNQAGFIDRVEVGRRVAGHVRSALEVDDSRLATRRAMEGGASLVADPTRTPWNSLNARLEGAAGLQQTLFEELG